MDNDLPRILINPFTFQEVHFGAGVSEQIVSIEILEDPNPEPDEIFEIILASPKNGLIVGDPGKGKKPSF